MSILGVLTYGIVIVAIAVIMVLLLLALRDDPRDGGVE